MGMRKGERKEERAVNWKSKDASGVIDCREEKKRGEGIVWAKSRAKVWKRRSTD